MRRLSTRSNPTNLTEIPRDRVTISLTEVSGDRYFTVSNLELKGLGLDEDLKVLCVARGGGASQRYDLGTVGFWKRDSFLLNRIPKISPIRFRVLVRYENSPLLKASAENLRLTNGGHGESLLPMEPDDLGEQLWRLDITADAEPVLKYNARVFPNAAAVEN